MTRGGTLYPPRPLVLVAGQIPCRHPKPRPRRMALGNRRSRRTLSSHNRFRCRTCGSTVETSTGWKGGPQEQGRSVVVRAAEGPSADRHDSSAIQRAHARARIRRRLVDRVGRRRHLLQLRRRPSLSSGVPDASVPQPLTPEPPARDRQWRFADGVIDHRRNRWIGVREDHTGRGRAGQHHRRRRSRRRRRQARARERPRFLCVAAAVAGRQLARLAGVGSSQHAVERHHALPRGGRG